MSFKFGFCFVNSLKSFRTNLAWNKEHSHAGGEYLTLVRNKQIHQILRAASLSSISSLWGRAMISVNMLGRSGGLATPCLADALLCHIIKAQGLAGWFSMTERHQV